MSLILSQEMGVTLAQRRRCGTRDCAFLHLCNLSGFFWIWSFYTNEHEAKVRYPRRHWMSLRIRLIKHGMILMLRSDFLAEIDVFDPYY